MPVMEWFQEGHVALVTGGSRGLGKALARELLGKGLTVIIDGRNAAELERARRNVTLSLSKREAQRGDLVAIPGDVADRAHVHALIEAAKRIGRLDLVINNASTLGRTPLPRIDQLGHETFQKLFDVNVFAPIHLIQHALPLMQRSGLNTIVNITSDAGVEAYPMWGGYGATKAALERIARARGRARRQLNPRAGLRSRRHEHRHASRRHSRRRPGRASRSRRFGSCASSSDR
jgi:NAD(P)-dependent dehydrogenase (short-subunit alcohol dehydrogenase family)